jgi:bacterioferritin-associated ferredoxin
MNDSQCKRQGCGGVHRLVCACLSVSEAALVEALTGLEIKSIKEIRRLTGAGDGCMACHKRLKAYLEGTVVAAG